VNSLMSLSDNRTWFDLTHTASFSHTTYDVNDIDTYWLSYGECGPQPQRCPYWFHYDFGKPGLENAKTVHSRFYPTLQKVTQTGDCTYEVSMTMAPNLYGPPAAIKLLVDVSRRAHVRFSLVLMNKTACRMPEALWYSFNPRLNDNGGGGAWTIDKANHHTPVDNVVVNGTRHTHAVWNGVHFRSTASRFRLQTLDAGIVALGDPTPFPTPLAHYGDPSQGGVHFNLFNNIWSTNYPLWYPFIPQDTALSFDFAFHVEHGVGENVAE